MRRRHHGLGRAPPLGAEGAREHRQKRHQHDHPEHDAECQRYPATALAPRRPRTIPELGSVLEPETLRGPGPRPLGIPVGIRGHGSPALSGAWPRVPDRLLVRLPLPTRARNAHRLSVPPVRYDICQQ